MTVTRHGGDHATGAHFANANVGRVGDEDIAGIVHRDRGGDVEQCAGGWAAVPTVAVGPVTRHGCDDATLGNFAHSFVVRIRNQQIAGAIHRHSRWVEHRRAGG